MNLNTITFSTKVMERPLVFPVTEISDDKELQDLIKFYNETLGFCPNSILTMYHRPEIAYSFIALNKAVMQNHESVSSSLKRLIGYITSNVSGCKYCQAHTIRAAQRYGAGERQINEVWNFEKSDAFNEKEKAALSFALHASMIPNSVTNEVSERLRSHWTQGEIVEITGVVALFGFLNRWNDSMSTEIEAGAKESGELLLSSTNWEAGKHSYKT
jgi:uncharacterized peroxidase-related enzyme